MNLVAHQLLSFNDESLMIGNLLGDFVRSKNYAQYSKEIANGILLHRAIDSFTDSHSEVKKSSKLLHATQGKYAPVIVDVLYDYFLIKHWQMFSNEPFTEFKNKCYSVFQKHENLFPENLQRMVKELIRYDWFQKYSDLEGVTETLTNMGKRRKYVNNLSNASKDLYLLEKDLEQHFLNFFPELLKHCQEFVKTSLR